MTEPPSYPDRDLDTDMLKLASEWVKRLKHEDDGEYISVGNDPKRPFGNSGEDQIARDILKIVGVDINAAAPRCPHCDEVLDEGKASRALDYALALFAYLPAWLQSKWPKVVGSLAADAKANATR